MSLFAILNAGSQSLLAQRARTNAASQNVANVDTEGFTRRRVELGAIPGIPFGNGALGGGVEVLGITRARDRFLEAQVTRTYGAAAQSAAERDVLFSVSVFSVDQVGGITDQAAAFFGALRGMAQSPESVGARQEVLAKAGALASSIRTASDEIEQARSGVDERLRGQVPIANQLASGIARLNQEVQTAVSVGKDPNDLMDERMLMAEKLAELTGATAIADDKGNVNLFLAGQVPLVLENNAASLDLAINPANRGHLDLTLTSADGTGPRPLDPDLLGGTIGGELTARDQTLRTASDDLDTLAFEFAAQMNAAHAAGFGLDGSTGRALFDAGATVQGAAGRLVVDSGLTDPNMLAASATAAGIPGDGDNALVLSGLESVALPSGRSVGDFANAIMTTFGGDAQRADAIASQDAAIQQTLAAMRAEVSGVSVDEEIVNLTEAQRAFEAVGKVIQTTDSMLETVLSLK